MKSILDRSFQYTRSDQTDLRKTFARVRREQALQARSAANDMTLSAFARNQLARLSGKGR